MKGASLLPEVRADQCCCVNLVKVKQTENLSDKFGIK
jgi:hypothetical protein